MVLGATTAVLAAIAGNQLATIIAACWSVSIAVEVFVSVVLRRRERLSVSFAGPRGYLSEMVAECAESRTAVVGGFDAAPTCRECSEGKHGACNGEAIVEGPDGAQGGEAMSDIVKGEIVEAVEDFYGYDVRPNKRGMHENRWVNVRYVRSGWERNVFRIERDKVRQVRQVGVPPEGGIPLEHPALAWLWEDASRLAERFGFCREFDNLADALGAPGREREFRIPMISEDGIRVTATVRARSRRLAEQRIRERIAGAAPLELTGGAS
ncbi:hypothetical protein QYM36_019432 [Artemia franciscana]|uniref:Uncharacterized protein n=1 Tax=Artemia franciscana TaxID=6661 RepID=A0AA88H7A0_ARTSF|nr:hypothetical protein QYM36_019432 [Artemia franciscana]